MKHFTDTNFKQQHPTAVTIGNFDGLHMGHRSLIQLTKDFAQDEGLESVVFTFSPHPMLLFQKKNDFALVMAPSEKKFAMGQMGIDVYVEYPFTEDVATMDAEDFANHVLFQQLHCKVLIVGENYKFGHNKKGNYALLKKLGEEKGIKVIEVPSVLYQGIRVSSSRIRQALVEKDLSLANQLLTVPYFILGEVQRGKKLGRTLGFPTTNVEAHPLKLFPPNGVYATKTLYDGKMYYGVTNIGKNPTVNGTHKVVETHLFDFSEKIYGETLQTYFFHWLRKEEKFPGIDALQDQLKKDVAGAKAYFASSLYDPWRDKI